MEQHLPIRGPKQERIAPINCTQSSNIIETKGKYTPQNYDGAEKIPVFGVEKKPYNSLENKI
jgi:hypothetical protein